MKPLANALIAALMMTASPALAFDPGAMSEAEKQAFGGAVRDYLLENPDVLIEAMNALEQRRLAGEAENDAAMIAQRSDQIYEDGVSWVGGNPDGDVTVVEFIDYRCGVCRQAFPHVEEVLARDGNLRLILKDLPILGEESELAARFAIAVKQIEGDDAYKQVHDHFYSMRGNVTPDGLRAIAEKMGFDTDAVIAAMNGDDVTDVLRENARLAQALNISGTPSFIIGDTLLRGMPQTGIVPVIEEARASTGG
ncbi:Protein-disulfide isomerase [Paracoccus isoporae]|uniref:Protein-disulfide isomerase n=1 Tax=Paracoccus isoporae TaxID=591205 RepID=A0A1G6X7X3_9RHOB|nr:DsbA family protein [Paracoccus isoporae]SDD74239.1 Protein-disulfide isomerase [Paracoccus isoporae]